MVFLFPFSFLFFLAIRQLYTNNITGLLATQPELVAGLANMTNITLLAPSNAALQSFLSTAGTSAAATPGFITALLQYHVLNGTYHALNFTSRPQFLPTMLNNATFVNVTGGQRVEAMRNGTNVTITSGFVSKSSVVTPVSFPSLNSLGTKLILKIEFELHRRNNPHHRPRPHPPRIRLQHRRRRKPHLSSRCTEPSESRQPRQLPPRRHHLRASKQRLPSHRFRNRYPHHRATEQHPHLPRHQRDSRLQQRPDKHHA